EVAHQLLLVVAVHRERHHAVDVGGREAGVEDRRAARLGGELHLAPARLLRELGGADAGDDGAGHELATLKNGVRTPRSSRNSTTTGRSSYGPSCGGSTRFDTRRVPSSSSTRITTRGWS